MVCGIIGVSGYLCVVVAGTEDKQAQELAEASTKKHIAEEAADVTYFMASLTRTCGSIDHAY